MAPGGPPPGAPGVQLQAQSGGPGNRALGHSFLGAFSRLLWVSRVFGGLCSATQALGGDRSLRERTGKKGSRVRGPPGSHGSLGSCQAPIAHSALHKALHPWETEPREAAGHVLRGSLGPLESCSEKFAKLSPFVRCAQGLLRSLCAGAQGRGSQEADAWLASLFPSRAPRAHGESDSAPERPQPSPGPGPTFQLSHT